ncbi:MAG: hypothetical protein JKY00_02065 [Roseicyclus sp.]|nr:hypothetical protein [Roseicyclus sp.]
MADSFRRRLQRAKTLGPDDLAGRPAGSRVLMSSTAGFANQVRSALAITSSGLVPVIQTNAEYRATVMGEEGIDLGALFTGIAVEETSDLTSRVYRDWIIPPWKGLEPAQAAEVFNILNWPGLVNGARLAHMPDLRRHMREIYDAFGPRLDRATTVASVDPDMLAIHLRMFARNYDTRYVAPPRNVAPARHYAKEAWSAPRLATAVSALSALSRSGAPVAIYTDRRDHPDMLRFLELAQDAGFKPQFADLDHDGALGAMQESQMLSGHRRMVLTSTSSFGHLAALLAEDLEVVLSA